MALIGGLLVVQLIALGIVVGRIEYAEANSFDSTRSLLAVERSNWLAATLSATTLSCFAYTVTGDLQCLRIYRRGKDSLIEDMNSLSPAFNDNVNQRATADQTIRLITNLIGVLEETARDQPLPHNERMIQLVRLELLPKWTELYKLHDELVAQQEEKAREGPENARAARWQNLIWLIAVQLASAAILAVAFKKWFAGTSPTPSSSDTGRTIEKQPQNPTMKNDRDTSKGDKLFQLTANSASGSTEQNSRVAEMLTKEMRPALASVQDALESVIEDHEDDLPEPAQRRLNNAHAEVAKLLKQIHDLGLQK